MKLRETHINEFDLFNLLWWQFWNNLISLDEIRKTVGALELEVNFFTFNGYRISNKEKTIIYEHGKE
jgi:hypothetical protein